MSLLSMDMDGTKGWHVSFRYSKSTCSVLHIQKYLLINGRTRYATTSFFGDTLRNKTFALPEERKFNHWTPFFFTHRYSNGVLLQSIYLRIRGTRHLLPSLLYLYRTMKKQSDYIIMRTQASSLSRSSLTATSALVTPPVQICKCLVSQVQRKVWIILSFRTWIYLSFFGDTYRNDIDIC